MHHSMSRGDSEANEDIRRSGPFIKPTRSHVYVRVAYEGRQRAAATAAIDLRSCVRLKGAMGVN